jgi:hypothetical protein
MLGSYTWVFVSLGNLDSKNEEKSFLTIFESAGEESAKACMNPEVPNGPWIRETKPKQPIQ